MPYQLFDKDGKEVTHQNLQDKGLWCQKGLSKEEGFVERFGKILNLKMNPEKEDNPYAPDLLNTVNGLLADLKTQNTPFFQARTRFGYDPQYTVVFNHKDRLRYQEKYPNIEIYFAVDWQIVTFIGKISITVKPMQGIWLIPFIQLNQILENAPFHTYQQRREDRAGNAKGSYVLNLLDKRFIKIK